MSLYDKASLVLIPSGTKAGTVYSQKPTSGDGDFDFTRATYATRVNSQGLIEKERSNLLLQSNNFDTTWSSSNLNTPTNGFSGYDGSSDAWKIEASSSAFSRINQSSSISGLYTFSVYAKKAEYDYIGLYFNGVAKGVVVSLVDGSVVNSIVNYPDIYADAEDIGSGWYRVSIAHTLTGSGEVSIYPCETTTYNGNTTYNQGIYIQDAQLEQGLVATDYIETTTSAIYTGITDNVPRLDYDGDCPSLLLEPQRTNGLGQSEYFDGYYAKFASGITYDINTSETTSPEGLYNATKLISSINNEQQAIYKNISVATPTFTCYAKAAEFDTFALKLSGAIICNFTLTGSGSIGYNIGTSAKSIESVGNGWYRCSISSTSNSVYAWIAINGGNTQGDGTSGIYIWGAQIEEGSYATSYIPTYGTSVTRNADDLELPTLSTAFDSSSDYTVFFEHGRIHEGIDAQFLYLRNVDYNYITLNAQGSGNFNVGLWNGSEFTSASYNGGDFNVGSPIKVAVRVQNSTTTVFINGSEIYIDKTYIVPRNFTTYQNNRNHRIHKELYISEALTDQECIDLTT